MQRRVRLTIGYRGTRYAGWALQSRARRPTVQATVEAALSQALGHDVKVSAAGRTDAGVHADAQVVAFDTSSPISCDGLLNVLRRWLPDDVWPVDAEDTTLEFNPRHSARRRWYRYALWRSGTPSVAWQGRCLVDAQRLDLGAIRKAARALLGRHDFGALITRPSVRGSTERTVFAADWLEINQSLNVFEICADAFLKQMVRTIVGSLLWVGSGRWTPERFAFALSSADRRAAGPNAPAVGLTLHRIEY
jgi:tRNA pseudouridine38-40 synthase